MFLIKISRKHIIARSFKLSMISFIMSRLPVIFFKKNELCPLQTWTLKTCNHDISSSSNRGLCVNYLVKFLDKKLFIFSSYCTLQIILKTIIGWPPGQLM